MPLPGGPVRGSRKGKPVMALLDLLGRRWALRILWELRGGAQSFRSLQASAGEISPSILNTRTKELREAGLVEAGATGYALTASGQALLERLLPLAAWADDWAAALARSSKLLKYASGSRLRGKGPAPRRDAKRRTGRYDRAA